MVSRTSTLNRAARVYGQYPALAVVIGGVAPRDLREALAWARAHRPELQAQWDVLNG